MDYLTDITLTVPNPGLKENIIEDVKILNFMNDFWKYTFENSDTAKYIVRKYIATVSGAFLMYPGSLLENSFYPKSRSWYSRAIEDPERMIFIPPYIDIGGSGYIITISQAIYKKNLTDGAIGGGSDYVWAVMAIDLTVGYFYKIIDEMVPICKQNRASCFLIDDYGYLIVHSSLSKPGLMSLVERQHITHKEPQLMNDLLKHKNFVEKLVCNRYSDRTMQRYYKV